MRPLVQCGLPGTNALLTLCVFYVSILRQVASHSSDQHLSGRISNLPGRKLSALVQNGDEKDFKILTNYVGLHYVPWVNVNIPSNANRSTPYLGAVFKVMVHHQPPMVVIDDWAAQGQVPDPGNSGQTRTAANGRLSGLTIQFLEELASRSGAIFQYYYACPNWNDNQICKYEDVTNKNVTLAGLTKEFCKNKIGNVTTFGLCFAAGAIKLTSALMEKFDFTQPIFETNFKLITMSGAPSLTFMTWADPFDWSLWLFIVFEVLIIGAFFMYLEGYGTNDEHITDVHGLGKPPLSFIAVYFESCHWALLVLIGASDKLPTTNGGRTVYLAQLFFTLIMVSLYTGSLINFLLAEPTATSIQSFEDLYDPAAPYYQKANTVCVAQNQPSMRAWLNLVSNGANLFSITERPTLDDCVKQTYLRETTATFYDEPTINDIIMNQYILTGMCGQNGAYCSDPTLTTANCLCPSSDDNNQCQNPAGNTLTAVAGTLVPIGDGFNPIAYSIFFPKGVNRTDYLTFNAAIFNIRSSSFMLSLEDQIQPPDPTQCASNVDAGVVILEPKHIFGILVITGGFFGVGIVIGIVENFIGIFLDFLPCFARPLEVDFYDDEEEEIEEPPPKPAPPSLDKLDEDLTVCEAMLELQTRFDRIEELLQTAIVKAAK